MELGSEEYLIKEYAKLYDNNKIIYSINAADAYAYLKKTDNLEQLAIKNIYPTSDAALRIATYCNNSEYDEVFNWLAKNGLYSNTDVLEYLIERGCIKKYEMLVNPPFSLVPPPDIANAAVFSRKSLVYFAKQNKLPDENGLILADLDDPELIIWLFNLGVKPTRDFINEYVADRGTDHIKILDIAKKYGIVPDNDFLLMYIENLKSWNVDWDEENLYIDWIWRNIIYGKETDTKNNIPISICNNLENGKLYNLTGLEIKPENIIYVKAKSTVYCLDIHDLTSFYNTSKKLINPYTRNDLPFAIKLIVIYYNLCLSYISQTQEFNNLPCFNNLNNNNNNKHIVKFEENNETYCFNIFEMLEQYRKTGKTINTFTNNPLSPDLHSFVEFFDKLMNLIHHQQSINKPH